MSELKDIIKAIKLSVMPFLIGKMYLAALVILILIIMSGVFAVIGGVTPLAPFVYSLF